MLPPPTTSPSWTPVAATRLSSSVTRSITAKSIPAARSPAKASPEPFSSARRNFSSLAHSVGSQLDARESPDLHIFARLRGQRLDEVAHGDGVVLDEFLLHQHGLLEELLEPALDDLLPHRLGLLLLHGLRLEDAALPLDHLSGQGFLAHSHRPRRRDVHAQVLRQCPKVVRAAHEIRRAAQL